MFLVQLPNYTRFFLSALNLWPKSLLSVLICLGCQNKIPQTWRLKQQKCIFSLLRRFEVQDQGGISVGFQWGLSSWLVDCHLLAPSSHGLFSVHTYRKREIAGISSSSNKDTSSITLGSHPCDIIWPSLPPQWPCLQILSHWELGLQHIHLGGHNTVHNIIKIHLYLEESHILLYKFLQDFTF